MVEQKIVERKLTPSQLRLAAVSAVVVLEDVDPEVAKSVGSVFNWAADYIEYLEYNWKHQQDRVT